MAAQTGTVELGVGELRALIELERCVGALVRDKAVPVQPYPAIVTKLVKLLRDPDYRMDALVQLIAKDQGVAASVLRYANAASWGAGGRVGTLPAAIMRLGSAAIQRIVLATTLGAENKLGGPLIALRRRVWRDSVLAAYLAESLARSRGLDPDETFIAGLLHDIGKLAAVSAFELAIERIGSPVLDMETWWSVIERHHVEMGVALAGHWHLPKSLMSVIANHHTRSNEGARGSVMGLIQAVDMVVELAEYHPSLSLDLLLDTPLTAPERLAVMDFLPGLASQVAALENPGGNVKPSLVSVPDVAISAPFRRVNVEAKVVSPKVDPLTFTHIGPLGIIAVAPQPLVAGQLHQLHIQPAEGEPLDLWATPYAITDAAVPHVHLLKPFVVDGATHARYLTWVKHGP